MGREAGAGARGPPRGLTPGPEAAPGPMGAVGWRPGLRGPGEPVGVALGCPAVLVPAPRDMVDHLGAWVQSPPGGSMM